MTTANPLEVRRARAAPLSGSLEVVPIRPGMRSKPYLLAHEDAARQSHALVRKDLEQLIDLRCIGHFLR